MRKIAMWGAAVASAVMCAVASLPAQAQVSALPKDVQDTLAQVGPDWGKALGKNIATTIAAFQPLLRLAPKAGIDVAKGLHYGEDPKQVLDLYKPQGKDHMPVVIFIHGGAYIRGDKDAYGEIYGNIPTWFARQGMLGINANYPLAPDAAWPTAAENVARIVAWAKANVVKWGGDPNKIFLVGHSAGATHIATYIFDKQFQPEGGAGVAGAVLISGRYRLAYDAADPNGKNMQAYFGTDAATYAARSAITHVADLHTPVFIVICEYDNPGLDVSGAELEAALCEHDGRCPRFTRLEKHNHLSEVSAFNTTDVQLGREIVDFMKGGR